jgi:hypothetical protein
MSTRSEEVKEKESGEEGGGEIGITIQQGWNRDGG